MFGNTEECAAPPPENQNVPILSQHEENESSFGPGPTQHLYQQSVVFYEQLLINKPAEVEVINGVTEFKSQCVIIVSESLSFRISNHVSSNGASSTTTTASF